MDKVLINSAHVNMSSSITRTFDLHHVNRQAGSEGLETNEIALVNFQCMRTLTFLDAFFLYPFFEETYFHLWLQKVDSHSLVSHKKLSETNSCKS